MDHVSEGFFNDGDNNDQFPTQQQHNQQLEANLDLLRAMGFSDEEEIRQALTISKNDINEAVAILTHEKLPKISTLGGNSTKSSIQDPTTSTTSHIISSSGNEIVMTSDSNSDSPSSSGDTSTTTNNNNNTITTNNNTTNNNVILKESSTNETFKSTLDSTNPLVFPYECLLSLENSVFTDNWSIPYKKDEWLDRLLTSTIAHIKEGTADGDQNCLRFLTKVLPEVYRKLLDTQPVNKWNNEIQLGVFNMTTMCVELVAFRLEQLAPLKIVPDILLEVLSLIFNQHCIFHMKNSMRTWDNNFFIDASNGAQNLYSKDMDTNGWLLSFINQFGLNKGFDSLKIHMENTTDMNELNILLKPIATCVRFLNPLVFKQMLENVLRKIIELISSMANDDFKDKNVGRVFDLLLTIKKIATELFSTDIDSFHKLHLNTVLNMLKYSHFNSKMNSLKEICKLIESAKSDHCASIISDKHLAEWLVNNRILSLAVEGNIDQSQYCEKIKSIVEFIGDRITNEEISALWNMQFNKSLSIIENLYIIIGIAATKFNPDHEQLDFLIGQIIQTWNDPNFKLHDKLVGLLRIIGRDSRSNKTYTRILEALWELKNRPGLSRPLLLLIFSEHLNVLNGGRMPRDQAKSSYIKRCYDDMKRAPGTTISIAALRHMYDILSSYQKNATKQLKEVLHEIVQPLMKQFCTSLAKCHSNAVEKAQLLGIPFDQNVLVDDIFTHEEAVRTHLYVLKFILTEGNLYLNLPRAYEIWDILITNESACAWDRQTGFEWFIESWLDLKDESKAEIFRNRILMLRPNKLTVRGYECFRLYFVRVNEFDQRIQCRFNTDIESFQVDKLDLIGLNYLWDIILYVEDEQLAELATKFLLDISFEKVSPKLKREIVQLHQRIINECYSRLENCLIALDTNSIGGLLLNVFKLTALATGMIDVASSPVAPRSEIFKCIARILMIAEKYILTVEENLSFARTCLPHYLSYRAESYFLNVFVQHSNDTNKTTHLEIAACANETLGELKLQIASQLNVTPSSLMVYSPEQQQSCQNISNNSCPLNNTYTTTIINNNSNLKLLTQSYDYKLLSSLNIDGMHPLQVKLASTYPPTTCLSSSSTITSNRNIVDFALYSSTKADAEQEKSLPGVLIANNGFAFDMFTRLDDLDQAEIRARIRNILRLIPTNPKLVEAFDSAVLKRSEPTTASVAAAVSTLVKSPSTSSMNIPTSSLTSSQPVTPSSQSNPCTPTVSTLGSSSFLLNNPFLRNHSSRPTTQTSENRYTVDGNRGLSASPTASTRCRPNQVTLEKYFDKNQVSLNRILYNLEVLCGRLMPPHSISAVDHSKADTFQYDFLQANGLKVLVSLLRLETFTKIETTSDEYETKEDILLLLLQLLYLLIFGSYYPFNHMQISSSHNKRPSSEPMSCCSSAPKKAITQSMMDDHLSAQQQHQQSNIGVNISTSSYLTSGGHSSSISCSSPHTLLNTKFALATTLSEPANLVERMPLQEINDLIGQLLILFWSAAAGNIQMSSTSVRTGSTATLTDELTSSSNPEMQTSETTIGATTTVSNDDPKMTTTMVKSNASEEMMIVHDIDDAPEEFPKVSLLSQSSSSSRVKEVKFFLPERAARLSTGSNMSTGSVESSNTASTVNQFSPQHGSGRSYDADGFVLQPGCCIRQKKEIKIKDVKIASKAIEIISCFVQYRKDCLPDMMSMKLFNECILDTLTGSISSEVRTYMEKFLLKLIQTDAGFKNQLMNVIVRARLPLWLNSTLTRSSNQRLIAQSTQYFRLRCSLLENLTLDEQSVYGIDLAKMIGDELNWLSHFAPTKSLKHIDSVLLTGHLCLLKSLLTCATAPKADVGEECVKQLIQIYLFPASYILAYPTLTMNTEQENNMEPVCNSEESRQAAYRLLVELSRNCLKNYHTICDQLVRLHHTYNQALASSEWNIVPPQVTPRAECGFVGLKNGGATCYMNAVLQQIYAIPGLADFLLNTIVDEDDKIDSGSSENPNSTLSSSGNGNNVDATTTTTVDRTNRPDRSTSVYWQLQNVMAHLKESKLEYYVPEPFWKAFRMWGQEVNLREQQDAFDFFISLTDQIDEHLKKTKREQVFKSVFEGTFSNQFICTDCPHRYEREEMFLGLNLPIKSGNLQESLLQFVKDELLDGDNAYNCEKCNEKRSAIKRTCIQKLPKYLCIQLKRFDYDWESNRSLKFDDYFEFPRSLNVTPYTYNSINRSCSSSSNTSAQPPISHSASNISMESDESSSNLQQQANNSDIIYELVGIIVHSGQANAGHYYSFIKTSNYPTSATKTFGRARGGVDGEQQTNTSVGVRFEALNPEQEELLQLEQLNQSIDENLYASMVNQVRMAREEKWFKFNDTSVEEINLTDQTLMEECFGGTFTQSSEFKMLPEERIRYWNGYMLFYREPNYSLSLNRGNMDSARQQQQQQTTLIKLKPQRRETPLTTPTTLTQTITDTDSLSQLAELISKGDEKGIFRTKGLLADEIEQIVKAENLEFCRNRAIYDPDYFQFIYNMVRVYKDLNLLGESKVRDSEMFAVEAAKLSLEFLYNTYFKMGKKLRTDLNKWLELLKDLLLYSRESALYTLNFIMIRESNSSFIRHYLLECPIIEIREACASLFEYCLTSLVAKFEFQPCENHKLTNLSSSLVQLLDKAVIDLYKNSHEYFKLLYVYANMSKGSAQQLISLSIFNKLFCFLLGNPGVVKSEEQMSRRWSPQQMKEFAIVYELIASLVLQCNIFSLKTCDIDDPKMNQMIEANRMSSDIGSNNNGEESINQQAQLIRNKPGLEIEEMSSNSADEQLLCDSSSAAAVLARTSSLIPPLTSEANETKFPKFSIAQSNVDLLPIPQEMQIYLFGVLSSRYLKELVYAFEQINHSSLGKSLRMVQSCCYCNETFSANVIHQILLSINSLSSNDTKQALYLLNSIMLIEDPLQLKRLQLTLDGYKDDDTVYNGLLTIVRQNQNSDAKKSYHCVKFIVTLANQSNPCREYLLKTATNWEWSVNWLRQKMTESIATTTTSSYINWNTSSSKFHSNEDAEIRTFQRTKSAQRTLDDATALLRSTDIDI